MSASEHIPFVLTWYPSHEVPPRPVDASFAVHDTEMWWEDWAATCTFDGEWRDPVMRSLITLKALTYHPNGRHRGGRHHVAARDTRGRAQLGLPLLLAPRRHADARGAHARRLPRGSPGVARLVVASRRPATSPSSRSCTGPPVSGVSTSGRSTGCRATRDRRRCGWATPRRASSNWTSTARCSRRCTRRARWAATLSGSAWDLQVALVEFVAEPLGGARRGHLGGPRPAPALHPLQGHGLGGGRPGGADGRGVRGRGARRTLAGAAGPASTTRCAPRGTTRRSAPSPSTTAPTPSTPASS